MGEVGADTDGDQMDTAQLCHQLTLQHPRAGWPGWDRLV